jgi:hypothetical protein
VQRRQCVGRVEGVSNVDAPEAAKRAAAQRKMVQGVATQGAEGRRAPVENYLSSVPRPLLAPSAVGADDRQAMTPRREAGPELRHQPLGSAADLAEVVSVQEG